MRFLQKTSSKDSLSLLVTNIIDFDDPSLQTTENVNLSIAQEVGLQEEVILSALQDLRKMEGADVSPAALVRQREQIRKEIVDSFNSLANHQRIVLFFDTCEKLGQDSWSQIIALVLQLENVLCLLAGRRHEDFDLSDLLYSKFEQDARFLDLEPLSQEDSLEYLRQKADQLHVSLRPELAQMLVLLTKGRPILIDLATDYFARAVPLEWITQTTPEEFAALPDRLKEEKRTEFERQLVREIEKVHYQMDRLTLSMSRVYPLNVTMISRLLGLTSNEAQNLFESAQTCAFVKILPGESQIVLHDEMERLIRVYVWENTDPDKGRRRRDSRIAAELFGEQVRQLSEQRSKLVGEIPGGDADSVVFVELERLEREREVVVEKWIYHALYADVATAFGNWQDISKQLHDERRYDFSLRLADVVKEYRSEFTPAQQYTYDYHYTRSKMGTGKYEESRDLCFKLLHDSTPDNISSVYNLLGIIETILGNFEQALNHQLECRRRIVDMDSIARVENQLGYIYRLLYQLDQSEKHYALSCKKASEFDEELTGKEKVSNQVLIASTYNNMGYVYGLQGDYNKAESYCQLAVDVWSGIERKREVGQGEITLAILAREQGFYERSIALLQRALRRLKDPDDYLQFCRAYSELGWTQWYKAESDNEPSLDVALLKDSLQAVEKSGEIARKYQLRSEWPSIYCRMARICWRIGDTQNGDSFRSRARDLIHQASKLSQEVGDKLYAIESLVGEAEFDLDSGRENRISEYVGILEEFQTGDSPFPVQYGLMYRVIGDFAFARHDLEAAFAKYAAGFPLINQRRLFGPFSIGHALSKLATRIKKLSPPDAEKWLLYLRSRWQEQQTNQHDNLLFWCDQQIILTRLRA